MSVPDKYFYTIGQTCKMTGTKPHVLRYWESQFKLLKPARRYSGHRKFTQREIDLINRIRYLIIDRKFTLAGAKHEINRQMNPKYRESNGSTLVNPAEPNPKTILREIKKEIEDCLSVLDSQKN